MEHQFQFYLFIYFDYSKRSAEPQPSRLHICQVSPRPQRLVRATCGRCVPRKYSPDVADRAVGPLRQAMPLAMRVGMRVPQSVSLAWHEPSAIPCGAAPARHRRTEPSSGVPVESLLRQRPRLPPIRNFNKAIRERDRIAGASPKGLPTSTSPRVARGPTCGPGPASGGAGDAMATLNTPRAHRVHAPRPAQRQQRHNKCVAVDSTRDTPRAHRVQAQPPLQAQHSATRSPNMRELVVPRVPAPLDTPRGHQTQAPQPPLQAQKLKAGGVRHVNVKPGRRAR